jgi:hypothetical protein
MTLLSKIPWATIATTVAGVIIGSAAFEAGKAVVTKIAAKNAAKA